MTDVTLHTTPRLRDVALEQIRIVGSSLRPGALIIAVVLAVGTFMIGGEILAGGPGFDSYETFPTYVIAFLFPFAVWRNEKRFGPAFLWTLPVERRRLALTRVFAGGVWLMAGLLTFATWLFVLGLIARTTLEHTILRVPYIETITAYLLGSALVVGLRYAVRWLIGITGAMMLLNQLTEALGRTQGEWRIFAGSGVTRPVVYGPYGLRTLLTTRGFFAAVEHAGAVFESLPLLAQWAITAFFGFGIGLTALWVAASRHRERRRH